MDTGYPNMAERLAKFPTRIASTLGTNPSLIIALVPGIGGYHPVRQCATPEEAERLATALNARWGADEAQRQAADVGSMFGWHVPGADPDMWRERAADR